MSLSVKPKRAQTPFEALCARLLCGAPTSADVSVSGFGSLDAAGAGAVAGAAGVGAALLRGVAAAARRPSGIRAEGP
jgi:hypothetical protein